MLKSNWQRLGAFLALVGVLSVLPYQNILAAETSDSPWVYGLMIVPALAAIICTLVFREKFATFGWWPRRPDLMLLAIMLPMFVEIATVAICDRFGLAALRSEYISINDGLVSIHQTALLWGAEPQRIAFFAFNFVLTIIVASLIYLPLALGEELGWRGYFQRHAVGWLGFAPGVIILGLVWGYWHAPAVLIGHNFPNFPQLGAFVLMPVTTIALSFVLGALYRAARSIWVPALLHGSLNLCTDISNRALGNARDSLEVNLVWIGLWVLLGATAWWIGSRSVEARGRSTASAATPA